LFLLFLVFKLDAAVYLENFIDGLPFSNIGEKFLMIELKCMLSIIVINIAGVG